MDETDALVEQYLLLGLRLGRHVDGFVDAYIGPPALAATVAREPIVPPAELAAAAAGLLGALDGGAGAFDPTRRHVLRGQVRGLHTSARKLAGESLPYRDEVELGYGVRPERIDESVFDEAHRSLDRVLPGSGPVAERFVEWRQAHVVPPERVEAVVADLADDLRERTILRFGLPEGERVDWELVTNRPWSGFNYYTGDLHSRVAINVDLPVPSPTIGHLVAHEAYPGHHTEHCRKEVGLVRFERRMEETIFCVGTPQCVVAEGLADLGLEVVVPGNRWEWLANHLRTHRVDLEPEQAATVAEASEALGSVRANVALLLNEDGGEADDAVSYFERWGLVDQERATKSVSFLLDPTWRAYIHCYVDGLRLCRSFVDGDPERFERLITEAFTPDML